MGTRYAQLSLEDRCRIASLQAQGHSIRQIAAALDRAPSTIAREIKRNTGRKIGYKPAYADEQTRARRWKGSKLERNESLRRIVLDRLAQGWSPEQIAGRLAREQANAQRQPRDHLPLHLRPNRPHQRLQLAPLSPPRQEQTRMARRTRRQLRHPSSKAESRSPSAPPRPATGKRRATGKPTS